MPPRSIGFEWIFVCFSPVRLCLRGHAMQSKATQNKAKQNKIPPALWATGGLGAAIFQTSLLPSGGEVYPSPFPSPWPRNGGVYECSGICLWVSAPSAPHFFRCYFSYRFGHRFSDDFGSQNRSKTDKKSMQKRSSIQVCLVHRFVTRFS